MTYTYENLKAMTIADLREIARDLKAPLQGYTQMNKEHLLPALCAALGVDTRHHHRHAHRPNHGAHPVIDKPTMKATLRTLKTERTRALDAHDGHALHDIRRRIHALKHRLRLMAE
jgi:hypothetical protein